jgi:DNA-binding MarR family transcriptional regulator
MQEESVSKLLGACHEAKRIVELMPKLPQGMKPSHIHVIDIINQLQQRNGSVRVSDIGAALHVTNPGVTRLVNELVVLKAVEKTQSSEDKRVVTVRLTGLGEDYLKKYIEEYHREVAGRLAEMSDEDVQKAAGVIHDAYQILSGGEAGMR